jgi:hypothetical protein
VGTFFKELGGGPNDIFPLTISRYKLTYEIRIHRVPGSVPSAVTRTKKVSVIITSYLKMRIKSASEPLCVSMLRKPRKLC